ncbi:hypothetical protein DPMN_139177 [Dreissena polymorpha]|uniref:Uncharacterized protein n=1 Tax=Dreissena polymorpha TaxID=45954 RepID=A0A9D4G822_DREPO|nr:hypothetical protein DPMN_139177 [Dreissena polymorpha]
MSCTLRHFPVRLPILCSEVGFLLLVTASVNFLFQLPPLSSPMFPSSSSYSAPSLSSPELWCMHPSRSSVSLSSGTLLSLRPTLPAP